MHEVLTRLGLTDINPGAWLGGPLPCDGRVVHSVNPTTGASLGAVQLASKATYDAMIPQMEDAFRRWRMLPAPKRGEIVREIGEALRQHKDDLGALVTLEVGKLKSEGLGEVQEAIDMAD
ncbi:MAG: hypothetical protein RLZZ383_1852, partial [Pseudomonadota bacterium]